MLGRNGIDVAISIASTVLLVLVERTPCPLHRPEFLLRSQVACFAVAAEYGIIDEGEFLTLAHFVNHPLYAAFQFSLQTCIISACIRKGKSREIVAGAMTLEFRCRRVPSVGPSITIFRKTVCIAVVV